MGDHSIHLKLLVLGLTTTTTERLSIASTNFKEINAPLTVLYLFFSDSTGREFESFFVEILVSNGRATAPMSAFTQFVSLGRSRCQWPGFLLFYIIQCFPFNPDSWIHLIVTSVETFPNYPNFWVISKFSLVSQHLVTHFVIGVHERRVSESSNPARRRDHFRHEHQRFR